MPSSFIPVCLPPSLPQNHTATRLKTHFIRVGGKKKASIARCTFTVEYTGEEEDDDEKKQHKRLVYKWKQMMRVYGPVTEMKVKGERTEQMVKLAEDMKGGTNMHALHAAGGKETEEQMAAAKRLFKNQALDQAQKL